MSKSLAIPGFGTLTVDPNYKRVAPRDLFNEASFLKCLGHLALKIHDNHQALNGLQFDDELYAEHGIEFGVDSSSGDLVLLSRLFYLEDGSILPLGRPLNNRQTWPLYFWDEHGEQKRCFGVLGDISVSLENFLKSKITD